MAIKGKSKSRGAKGVTAGPKPAYVPVKTPFLRRRGLWIAVANVLGLAAVAGLTYGFVQERNDTREQEQVQRMATAINRYRGEVDPILATVGTAVPPSTFAAFPALGPAISGLEGDQVGQDALDQATTGADATAESAANAAGTFEDVDTNAILEGKDLTREFVLYVLNSRTGFLRGMNLFEQAALLTGMAAEAEEGDARDELIARAGRVHDLAQEVVGAAYSDYVQAQILAEVFAPTNNGVPLTGPTG
jgi:hypothetical protein